MTKRKGGYMDVKKFQEMDVKETQKKFGAAVAFECPSCGSEVSLNEIIEKTGSIRCVKCL